MFDALPLLIGVLVALERRPVPDFLDGKVVDVLPGNRVLLSLGAEQGARRGMEIWLYRDSKRKHIGSVDLDEVGRTHSIGWFRPPGGRPYWLPQVGDAGEWEW